MYSQEFARRAGYTHVITFEVNTKFLGWQPASFHTTADAVELHLLALAIRKRFGNVRNVDCLLLATANLNGA